MMKRIILMAVLVMFGLSVLNNAQPKEPQGGGPGGPGGPDDMIKKLTEQLKLNKDQVKKIENIFKKQHEKMSPPKEGKEQFDDPSHRGKMEKMREEMDKEIMKVLDKKQKEQFKKFIEEQKQGMKEPPKKGKKK
jgi:hypothetical protein